MDFHEVQCTISKVMWPNGMQLTKYKDSVWTMIIIRLLFSFFLWAAATFVIFEGLNSDSNFDYLFSASALIIFSLYTLSGRTELLKGSLAVELSKQSSFLWFSVTFVSTAFMVVAGIVVAYSLDVILGWEYLASAETGILITLLFAAILLFLPHAGLSSLANMSSEPNEGEGLVPAHDFRDVLETDIMQLRAQGIFLLFLCGSIGVYAGYQATQAIEIVDSGGVSTESVNLIKERISERERLIFEALRETDFSIESERHQFEQTKEQIDTMLTNDRLEYQAELESIKSSSQDVTGRFVFTYFSSFFVRIGSVLISLGFFTIVFYQYRRIDRQRAELCLLRLAYLSIEAGHDPSHISSARKALAIRDYIPTRRETDSFGAFAAATIGGVPDILSQSGLKLNSSPDGKTSPVASGKAED